MSRCNFRQYKTYGTDVVNSTRSVPASKASIHIKTTDSRRLVRQSSNYSTASTSTSPPPSYNQPSPKQAATRPPCPLYLPVFQDTFSTLPSSSSLLYARSWRFSISSLCRLTSSGTSGRRFPSSSMLGDCPLLMVGRALFDGLFVTCGYTSAPSLLRRVSSSEGG